MVPSVPNTDPDTRPQKRPRKSTISSRTQDQDDQQLFNNNGPIDHIFITDGITKKAGGKKTPLSCCECRRLKLKCDRNFPCASCKKRGCAEICPDGVLVSGKGTRFILANTEQLHTKIHEMSDRIRLLEDALQAVQAQCSTDPHPLMRSDLLGIKSTMGLYSGAQVSQDAPASATEKGPIDDSKDRDSNSRMNLDPTERGSSEESLPVEQARFPQWEETSEQLTADISKLNISFPLSHKVYPGPDLTLRQQIRNKLPPRADAEYIWSQLQQNALWQYNPFPSPTFFPNLLHHCYTAPLTDLNPRRLGLLCMILAVGFLVDLSCPHPSQDAENFHKLARASMCEIPVMEETNLETVSALFYELWYLLVFSDQKKATAYAWALLGLTSKLAQAIGLHKNSNKGKVIPEEIDHRRFLLWELLHLDARLALSLGCPPSISFRNISCPKPSYARADDPDFPSHGLSYQEWKHLFYESCLVPVLEIIDQPSVHYFRVLELDKQIRDFSASLPLREERLSSRQYVMQKASQVMAVDTVLLQMHRVYFTRALSGPEESFNKRHKYAPSVVSVFLSATHVIAAVSDAFFLEPHLTARFLSFWSNAFSSVVALCLLVSRAPFTCLTVAGLQEMERARSLFFSAKDFCAPARQVFPILVTMIAKANLVYNSWLERREVPTVLRHITEDSSRETPSPSTETPYNFPPKPQGCGDSFGIAHYTLSQCILEVHERNKVAYPMRKPCHCSDDLAVNCPPSHSWSEPPKVLPQAPPVLPTLGSDIQNGLFSMSSTPDNRTFTQQRDNTPMEWTQMSPGSSASVKDKPRSAVSMDGSVPIGLQQSSRMAVVDSLNFELGAIHFTGDQNWMAFF